MFIKIQPRSKRGFTLVEMMVAAGLFGIATTAIMSIYLFSTRSFSALANYAELDKINRTAMDTLTREIRQAWQVTDVGTNSIAIMNGDGHSVSYYFNPTTMQLVRSDNTIGSSKVLVSSCTLLNFNVYQRNNSNGTFDQYPAAIDNYDATVKVIRLTWKASRHILGSERVSEDIQTARVVIRKQH